MADFLFLIGSSLVTFGVTYGLWGIVRVIRLRQDIFDKRDALFDVATELGAHDDPAYQEAREHLNSLAHLAKVISWQVVFNADVPKRKDAPLRAQNPKMQEAIDSVFDWSAYRIFRYLLKETLTGWVILAAVKTFGLYSKWKDREGERIGQWVRSEVPIELDRINRGQCRDKVAVA
jgi:hypothetical protein